MTELDILEIAERDRAQREFERNTDLALAAIMDALNYNGSWGWDDWSQAAARGEWA